MQSRHIIPCAAAAAVAFASLAFGQLGELAPPAGPVADTGPHLGEIEPRTPISNTGAPQTIDQPGSYYLTENITSADQGIEILAGGVTLDLNGFTISGDNGATSPGASEYGIAVVPPFFNNAPIVIKNGFIRNFFSDGVFYSNPNPTGALVVEGVHVIECGGDGIDTFGSVIVRNRSARACGGDGFTHRPGVKGTYDNCIAELNGQGFDVAYSTLSNCLADNNTTGFFVNNSALNSCAASNSAGSGIVASGASAINGCIATDNGSDGIIGSSGSTIMNCVARGNNTGISSGDGSTVANSTSSQNNGSGFSIGDGSRATNCTAEGNGLSGNGFGFLAATGSTIDSCTARNNPFGFSASPGALIIRCTASGNTTNYAIAAAAHGAIISLGFGAFSEPNSFANIEY